MLWHAKDPHNSCRQKPRTELWKWKMFYMKHAKSFDKKFTKLCYKQLDANISTIQIK